MANWLLQCDPLKWRLFDYLEDGHELRRWTIRRHQDAIMKDDRVGIWVVGERGGLIATGRVTSQALDAPESQVDSEYWREAADSQDAGWQLPLEITDFFPDHRVLRSELKSDPVFATSAIMKMANQSNPFPVTDAEWEAMTARLSQSAPVPWSLQVDERVERTELHRRFGGNPRSGISPSTTTPNILVFSDPASGERLGYFDERAADGAFLYAGEGQTGNQTMSSGNRALLEHREEGRAIRLFEGAGGTVRYIGEFVVDPAEPWTPQQAPQRDSDELRTVIRFRLVDRGARVSWASSDLSTGATYRPQDPSAVASARAAPASQDPDAIGRGGRAHRTLQNDLAGACRRAGLRPLSPSIADPDFDLAWHVSTAHLVVIEVKSLSAANEVKQLRLGLGQVMDYAHQLRARAALAEITPVLFVEREPADPRWPDLCQYYDVELAWPGREGALPGMLSP